MSEGTSSQRGPREVFARLQQQWLAYAPEAMDHFDDDLWAEDVVVEVPFNPPGTPRRYEGREEFRATAEAGRAALPIRFDAVRNVTVHETADPEVIVVEYELAATNTTTGDRAAAPFIGVLRARGGQVVHWREYQDVLAMTAAMGQLPKLLASFGGEAPDNAAAPAGP